MEITKQERKKNPKENRQSEQESQRNPELLPSRRRFLLAGGERCCALATRRFPVAILPSLSLIGPLAVNQRNTLWGDNRQRWRPFVPSVAAEPSWRRHARYARYVVLPNFLSESRGVIQPIIIGFSVIDVLLLVDEVVDLMTWLKDALNCRGRGPTAAASSRCV